MMSPGEKKEGHCDCDSRLYTFVKELRVPVADLVFRNWMASVGITLLCGG